MSTVPTDSVLRRHYEQMQRAALVPTDSVLRRHYEQMQQAARSGIEAGRAPEPVESASPPRRAASRPAPEPTASRPAPVSEPVATGQGGGFFGWIKRLFGG